MCLSEPLLIISYSLRFLRIKKIFEAQQDYFDTGVRPAEMIKSFREWRLANICVMSVGIYATVYMVVGLTTWGSLDGYGYGVLPSFALSTDVDNRHTFISLLYFVIATLLEGVVLAYFLDIVRDIKKEFSMLPELQ